MKFFDAHTHVQFAAYDQDREEVIARARKEETGMLCVGTQYDTSAAAVELAQKHDHIWAAVALHPIHTSKSYHDAKELGEGGKEFTSRGELYDISKYETLAKNPKTVAVGECGLDYYRLGANTKKLQQEIFLAQIELANKLQKPLMLHIRQAYEDALTILRAHARVGGDVHFFAGDWNIAKQFLDLGFTLSFTGVITFAHDYDEVIKNTPLDMLLSETDAPYVAPVPYRGTRNEPAYVAEVVKRIAEIKSIDFEVVREQILENAQRVFKINFS